MTDQINQKPAGRLGPPAWNECRYGSLNPAFYEVPMDGRRQAQPKDNRAEFLSGKFDNQSARPRVSSNRVSAEEFCTQALAITNDQGFIILRNLCKQLALLDPAFAETRISPPDLRFMRKNLVYLSLSAKDCYTRLRPEDRHLVRSLHAHINRVKLAYEDFNFNKA